MVVVKVELEMLLVPLVAESWEERVMMREGKN